MRVRRVLLVDSSQYWPSNPLFAEALEEVAARRGWEWTVLDESWLLDPAHGALRERLGRFEALATVLLAGPLFASAAEALRAQLEQRPVLPRSGLIESATALAGDMVVARFACTSVQDLLQTLRARLDGIPALLGDDPWARRT